MPVSLDRYDHRILTALSTDARISITQLAQEIGLSKTPVAARIKRLEAEGLITGYRAIVSPERLGLGHIAFVEVKLSDTRETALGQFNDAVRRIPEIEECHMIAGEYDYLLKVRTSSIESYRRVMGEQISALPFIRSTSTRVAMETVVDQTHPPFSASD